MKDKMPNGQLPVIVLASGKKMDQTVDILKYIGKCHGYYPEGP